MLTVCCVKWGTKYDAEYVNILEAMVRRNLSVPHKFVCFTDDPTGVLCETRELPKGLEGWWNKLYLFKEGMFDDRMMFLDLDVVIVRNMDELVTLPGKFRIIKDWNYDCYNSSVFVMDKDAHPEVWDDFNSTDGFAGDQDWIFHKVKDAKLFKASRCVSYRCHAVKYIPQDAVIVCFHGDPKPREALSLWVKKFWSYE